MTTITPIESRKLEIDKSRLNFVHVPTPGDHYSPATGSAVMTVIHGLTAPHIAAGRRATILVSKGTSIGYPPYPTGELYEIDMPAALPSGIQKMRDAICGRLFQSRPNAASQYVPVAEKLGPQFDGTVFLHNAAAAIRLLRQRLSRASLVLFAHNQLFNTYSAREIRRVLDCSDVVLCVSNFLAKDIVHRAGVRTDKIRVLLNGVDTEMFSPAEKPPKDSLILFLGRIQESKGPDLLLRAASLLPPSLAFKIRIVGSSNFNANDALTPYEHELRRLAAPLKEKVEFHPFVSREKVAEEYRNASIFVAPSNWDEPFGLTIAEAQACGLPCILSNRGGIPEVAPNSALYFTPPDVKTLAVHLKNLLENQALRQKLSERARARSLFLSWPKRYLSLLDSLNLTPAPAVG